MTNPQSTDVATNRSNGHRPDVEILQNYALLEGNSATSPISTLEGVLKIVKGLFGIGSIADGTEASISAMCSLLLGGTEGCIALIQEGRSSSGKTTNLDFIKTRPMNESGLVVGSDNFTAASFVTHASNRKKTELAKIDLLPRIRHKTLIVPDLAPIFSDHKDTLAKNVGVLTRVLDGNGYESDSGTNGHRGYTGDYRFVLLAATTPLRASAWEVMARLGNRIVLLHMGDEEVDADDLVEAMTGERSYVEKVDIWADAVWQFLHWLWAERGGYGSIAWDRQTDDQELVKVIAKVAHWVVRCRGTVITEGSFGDEPTQTQI